MTAAMVTGPDATPEATHGLDVRRIARAGALNLIGAAVSVVATVGLTVVVTRNASKDVAGAYFTLTSIFLILAGAARLGADTGTVYALAQHRARGEVGRVRATIRVAYGPTAVASVVLLGVAWFTAPWLARELFNAESGAAVTAIRVFALCLPFAVIGLVAQAAARGLGSTRPYVMMERVARPSLQLIGAAIVVAVLGSTAWVGLAASYSVPYILTAAIAVPWFTTLRKRTERKSGQLPLAATRADWTSFWSFSAPRAGTGLLSLALQRLDVIIVAALRGAADAALYTAATRFLVVGQTAANALSMAVQHRFSAMLSTDRKDDANRLYQMTTTWLILMTWPFYLTWVVLAPQLMRVFGDGYASAATVGVVLGLTMLIATGCGMVSMVLEMAGNTGITFLQTGFALAVDIGLDLILVPHLGPLGAAIGWSAAILANNLLPLLTLYRRYGFFPIGRAGLTAIGVAVVCFVAVPLLAKAVFGGGAVVALVAFVVGVGAYVVVGWRARAMLDLAGLRALRRRPARATTG
jgi:O-antigen/teichoic acid export membrane protein